MRLKDLDQFFYLKNIFIPHKGYVFGLKLDFINSKKRLNYSKTNERIGWSLTQIIDKSNYLLN